MIRMTCATALLLWSMALPAQAREAGGFDFPEQSQASGQPVSLVGVGVRTKWMVDVYGMGVYGRTVKKSASFLIDADEPKLLWLHLARGISADKMRDAIDEGIEKNTPEAERAPLAADLDKLKRAFPGQIPKGMDIQFAYVPGKGTTLRLAGQDKLTVAGKPFMRALWAIWFGHNPADKDLKKGVLAP